MSYEEIVVETGLSIRTEKPNTFYQEDERLFLLEERLFVLIWI